MTKAPGPQAHENTGDGPRAIGYIRVSSTQQEDRGYSLEDQTEKIHAYAREHAYSLGQIYADVISTDEPNPDREDFYRVLNQIETEQTDAVIVLNTSRLGRNMVDKSLLAAKADAHDVSLVGVEGDMDYMESPESELFYWMQSAMDRYKNRRRALLVRDARKKKAQHGYWPQGNSPTGYTTIQGDKGKVLEPDEQAWFIPQVFAYYIEVHSQEAVRAWARDLPYDVPCGQSTIGRILKNKVYLGLIPWNGDWYEGKHTPLVSEALWMEAKRVRRRGPGRPPKNG